MMKLEILTVSAEAEYLFRVAWGARETDCLIWCSDGVCLCCHEQYMYCMIHAHGGRIALYLAAIFRSYCIQQNVIAADTCVYISWGHNGLCDYFKQPNHVDFKTDLIFISFHGGKGKSIIFYENQIFSCER